jgi:L-amino acid N-acyltransferase YncA
MQFPMDARLKDGSRIQLALVGDRDIEPLRGLYRVIVDEGTSYPHNQFPSNEEFQDYWVRGKSTVVAYSADRVPDDGILGAFYLKPNWPGRAGHVANAGFIVAPEWRGKGLGRLLGVTMLSHARDLRYRSVLFNLVFSENATARQLWQKLGFQQLGITPGAVLKNDGTFQDAIIMWRSLLEKG